MHQEHASPQQSWVKQSTTHKGHTDLEGGETMHDQQHSVPQQTWVKQSMAPQGQKRIKRYHIPQGAP